MTRQPGGDLDGSDDERLPIPRYARQLAAVRPPGIMIRKPMPASLSGVQDD
jgi:hypothetical protein